jgi:hypothetical protein
MRRRAAALLIATLTAGALVVGIAGQSGAAVRRAKAPVCKGKTEAKAIAAIEDAYDHFLNGAEYPDPATDKAPYIQYMSEPNFSQSMLDAIVAGSQTEQAQESAGNTSVVVNGVECTGKRTAEVQAELVLGGTESPGIFPNPGGAILEKGSKTWKVTAETFCNLTQLGDAAVAEPPHPCADVLLGDEPADLEST